jgi:8-oxo-dGTP pyrophosphatase MutT (NUDIX family)
MVQRMLSWLPAPLHRAFLRMGQPVRLRVWGLLRREVRGCHVLAFDAAGRVLLVRHSYHLTGRWLLPGGGLARGEDPAETGARELAEETGCALAIPCWIATDVRAMPGGWRNRIELVTGHASGEPRADGREIAEAAFFDPGALPEAAGSSVHVSLARWREWQSSEG